MDAYELLTTRRSAHALAEPGPSEAALSRILTAAARVPDHGKLRPWRFILVRGAGLGRLGQVWADALRRRDPSLPEEMYGREVQKALRSPLLIVVACKADAKHGKIPEVEQILSTGAAAYALTLAAKAEGFGSMWKTGPAAYDDSVKQALGLAPTDRIVGFIHIGTEAPAADTVKRPDPRSLTVEWTGALAPA